MILKGLGISGNLILRGLVGFWQAILLTLKKRLFGLSLKIKPALLPLSLRSRCFVLTLPIEIVIDTLSLKRRNFTLGLNNRSFLLTLPR